MAENTFRELDNVRRYIYSCRTCGVCRYKVTGKVPYVCPVKKATPGFENFSSRGKIMLAQALLEGSLQPTEGLGPGCLQLHPLRQLHDPVRRH